MKQLFACTFQGLVCNCIWICIILWRKSAKTLLLSCRYIHMLHPISSHSVFGSHTGSSAGFFRTTQPFSTNSAPFYSPVRGPPGTLCSQQLWFCRCEVVKCLLDLQQSAGDHSVPRGYTAAQQVTVILKCWLGSGSLHQRGGKNELNSFQVLLPALSVQLQRD